jgi:hypothetical protein
VETCQHHFSGQPYTAAQEMSYLQVKPTEVKADTVWQGGPQQHTSTNLAVQKTQQHLPHASTPQKVSKKANKRRRHEDASKIQDSILSSLPSAKKGKLSDPHSINAISEDPTVTENPCTSEESALERTTEIESVIALGPPLNLSAYDVSDINIISSSKIQSKVNEILETLASFSFVAPTKPRMVIVHGKASVSSKCITVVEISKREIAKAGGKWYQYSRLEQTVTMQEKKVNAFNGPGYTSGRKSEISVDVMDIDEKHESQSIEEESGFETMKSPLERAIEGRPKVRAVPMLFIYLSRVRVDSLKQAYG